MYGHYVSNWKVETDYPIHPLDEDGIHINVDVHPVYLDRGGEDALQAEELARRLEDMATAARSQGTDMSSVIYDLEEDMHALQQHADSLMQQWEKKAAQLQTARAAQNLLQAVPVDTADNQWTETVESGQHIFRINNRVYQGLLLKCQFPDNIWTVQYRVQTANIAGLETSHVQLDSCSILTFSCEEDADKEVHFLQNYMTRKYFNEENPEIPANLKNLYCINGAKLPGYRYKD